MKEEIEKKMREAIENRIVAKIHYGRGDSTVPYIRK